MISQKGESGNVAEVNINILGVLNSDNLSTGKSVEFKKTLSYSLTPIFVSACNPHGSSRHTVISKLKDI